MSPTDPSFDLRRAIGALFVILGALLATYGLLSPSVPPHSAVDINLNLGWGVVMIVFGSILLLVSRRTKITS